MTEPLFDARHLTKRYGSTNITTAAMYMIPVYVADLNGCGSPSDRADKYSELIIDKVAEMPVTSPLRAMSFVF